MQSFSVSDIMLSSEKILLTQAVTITASGRSSRTGYSFTSSGRSSSTVTCEERDVRVFVVCGFGWFQVCGVTLNVSIRSSDSSVTCDQRPHSAMRQPAPLWCCLAANQSTAPGHSSPVFVLGHAGRTPIRPLLGSNWLETGSFFCLDLPFHMLSDTL